MENLQLAFAEKIHDASITNRLVVFVGAGVSNNSGVPTWNTLIDALKFELPESLKQEHDALKVAQMYKDTRGDKEFVEKVEAVLKHRNTLPNPLHKAILDLKPCHIITTNYDNLIEQAIANEKLQFHIISKDSDLPYTQYENMLIKMHGDFENNNIVLTETDYYNYENNFPLISTFIRSLFATKVILCVGFSFNDLNLKIITNSIKDLLGKDFQPVYLLVDHKDDVIQSNYLRKKGVQSVWIPKNEVTNFISDKKIKNKVETIESELGQRVYEQIRFLNGFSFEGENIIDNLHELISSFFYEIPFFITAIDKILPKSLGHPHVLTNGIQFITSNYFKKFKENYKEFSQKKNLLTANLNKISFLRHVAFINGVIKLDDLVLFSEASYKRRCEKLKEEKDIVDYIWEFDLENVSNRLKYLNSHSLNFTYEDLELPYAYFSLGKYYDAYQLYDKYSEIYWKNKKYILYFICKYNIKAISNGIYAEKIFDVCINVEPLLEEIRGADLNEILHKCPINEDVKRVFSDLLNYHNYLDLLKDSIELQNKIYSAKKSADKGGASANSNIPSLGMKLYRCLNFSTMNYIISTNVNYANEIFRVGVSGLLIAHKIPKRKFMNGMMENSRLEEIDKDLVTLMMFTIKDYKTLDSIWKQYDIGSIKITDEALDYITTIIKNIDLSEKYLVHLTAQGFFVEVFNKLLFICSKIDNNISNLTLLFKVFVKFRMCFIVDNTASLLSLNVMKSNLSVLECESIFNYYDEVASIEKNVPKLLEVLSIYMQEQGIVLSEDVELKILLEAMKINNLNVRLGGIYYRIANHKLKRKIINYFQKHIYKAELVAKLIIQYGIPYFNRNNLTAYIESLRKVSDNKDYLYFLLPLAREYKKSKDNINKKSIQNLAASVKPLLFLISPESILVNDVEPHWLYYCDNKQLKTLCKQELYRKKCVELIESDFELKEDFKHKFYKCI